MLTTQQIIQIAQTLQPQLSNLLRAETATTVDRQLTTLLKQFEQGQPVEEQVLLLLHAQEPLRPYLTPNTNKSFNLPGNRVAQPSSLIYKCSECNYTDNVAQQGMKPDPCPDHPNAVLQKL
jgi:hypothetical protein